MYYGDNYCVTVMYGYCVVWFRCVISHVSDVFRMTRMAWLESSGTNIFVHVLRFTVLIALNV